MASQSAVRIIEKTFGGKDKQKHLEEKVEMANAGKHYAAARQITKEWQMFLVT